MLDAHSRHNWTNEHGGPLAVFVGDPLPLLVGLRPPVVHAVQAQPPFTPGAPTAGLNYSLAAGFLAAGDDLFALTNLSSLQPALDACSAHPVCCGVTYLSSAADGRFVARTTVYLKQGPARLVPERETGQAWWSWTKRVAVVPPPAQVVRAGGLAAALRPASFSVMWLNATRAGVDNFSFVPPLTPTSGLPLVQHLGDVTLRVRRSCAGTGGAPAAACAGGGGGAEAWEYYASAWGALRAEAAPSALRPGELAAHDITPLLDATAAPGPDARAPRKKAAPSPLAVRRAYATSSGGGGSALEMRFELRNTAAYAVELGGFGMAMPAATAQVRVRVG